MATTPEGKIKKKLDKALKEVDDLFVFSPQAGPFGSSGIPDRIVCYMGEFIGIEVKADKTKEMTKLQYNCAGKIMDAGGGFFLVYDDLTIQSVIDVLASKRATRRLASDKC